MDKNTITICHQNLQQSAQEIKFNWYQETIGWPNFVSEDAKRRLESSAQEEGICVGKNAQEEAEEESGP